jgi:hypothetical protein
MITSITITKKPCHRVSENHRRLIPMVVTITVGAAKISEIIKGITLTMEKR